MLEIETNNALVNSSLILPMVKERSRGGGDDELN